jgi:hypothetical protein
LECAIADWVSERLQAGSQSSDYSLVTFSEVDPYGVDIEVRTEGLANLTLELDAVRPEQRAV